MWGLNVNLEQRLVGTIVYRGVASVDFLAPGMAFAPTLVAFGADVGLRSDGHGLRTLVALGAGVAYFANERSIEVVCQNPQSCSEITRGYEPGFVLTATGTLGLGVRVSQAVGVFTDLRVFAPSGWGANGAADDPHAAFVRIGFGLTVGL